MIRTLVFARRYNQISGEDLLQCGYRLQAAVQDTGKPLTSLVLTGNKVLQQHTTLIKVFSQLTHHLEAHLLEDTSVPFAEHIAQM